MKRAPDTSTPTAPQPTSAHAPARPGLAADAARAHDETVAAIAREAGYWRTVATNRPQEFVPATVDGRQIDARGEIESINAQANVELLQSELAAPRPTGADAQRLAHEALVAFVTAEHAATNREVQFAGEDGSQAQHGPHPKQSAIDEVLRRRGLPVPGFE